MDPAVSGGQRASLYGPLFSIDWLFLVVFFLLWPVLAGNQDGPRPPQGLQLTGNHLPHPPRAEIQGTVHLGIQLLQDGVPDRDSGRQGQTLSTVPSPSSHSVTSLILT